VAAAAPAPLKIPSVSDLPRIVRSDIIELLVFRKTQRIFQLHLHDSIKDSQAAGGKTTLRKICNRLF
jgi:hypothetical protein